MRFKLDDQFIHHYKSVEPPFGFNGLGELTYMRTYSRIKDNGKNEKWYETIRRVVEGTYEIQRKHITSQGLYWDENKAKESAEEMYDRMFHMKFLPPGRGLWLMGTNFLEERGLFAGLNNCAFVSTQDIDREPTKPFEFMMDMSMLGVGVGFDVKGEGKIVLDEPSVEFTYVIPDSREGWVESLRLLLDAYFDGANMPEFDYSQIREKGDPIKGFGGVSSGYEPLENLHNEIKRMFNGREGETITITDIVDIMNHIGVCVVAGNIRRTAEIALGDPSSEEYMKLKDYRFNPTTGEVEGSNKHRVGYGWTSNNSVFCSLGEDYSGIADQIATNGEPGVAWLDNMRKFSRMSEEPDYKDMKALGLNPCFSYDSKILTYSNKFKKEEYLNIGELDGKRGVVFVNKNGDRVKGRVWRSGNKDSVHLIYNKNGKGNKITCTPDHVFMLNNGKSCEAKDTKGKRLMPFYKMKDIGNDDSCRKYISLGFVQGDGRTNPSARLKTVKAIFGKKDYDVREYFDNSLQYSELEKYGFSKEKLPNRDLPVSFYDDWSVDEKNDFLTGLYSANGSVLTKANRVTLKSTNFKLVSDIHEYFELIGINSYITVNQPKKVNFSNGEYVCKESYDLNISRYDSIIRFAENIGFVQSYKRDSLHKIIVQKAPMIQHIVNAGKRDVYDFSLEDDTHWGVVDGVVAHNCAEQTLEPYELCCLVETFPTMNDDLSDYLRTLKFAYLYAKTVTLCGTHWAETNRVMLRNRRIGTSMSGIAQMIDSGGVEELRKYCRVGYETIQSYDKTYSEFFCVPRSIKTTSIKPSGTVSLLPGVTPGVHFPESNFYIRRVTVDKDSPIVDICKDAGFQVEPSAYDSNSVKVSIPVKIEGVRTIGDVSMWEQLHIASFMQANWADNQVSCTVTFKNEEATEIEHALDYFQYHLKAISFLPRIEGGAYAQMPYEEITEEEYNEISSKIKSKLDFTGFCEDSTPERFCDGQTCLLE